MTNAPACVKRCAKAQMNIFPIRRIDNVLLSRGNNAYFLCVFAAPVALFKTNLNPSCLSAFS